MCSSFKKEKVGTAHLNLIIQWAFKITPRSMSAFVISKMFLWTSQKNKLFFSSMPCFHLFCTFVPVHQTWILVLQWTMLVHPPSFSLSYCCLTALILFPLNYRFTDRFILVTVILFLSETNNCLGKVWVKDLPSWYVAVVHVGRHHHSSSSSVALKKTKDESSKSKWFEISEAGCLRQLLAVALWQESTFEIKTKQAIAPKI